MNYKVAADGRLHTRFSELKRATLGSVERLVEERHGLRTSFHSPIMEFGTLRHELWEAESKQTGKLPECFGIDEPVDIVEQEFVAEIFRGIVLHGRPDSIGTVAQTANDYKSISAGGSLKMAARAHYEKDLQLIVYAYLLSINGITIKKRRYLCEVWDKDRTKIEGYSIFEAPVTIADLARARKWLQERAELLAIAEHQFQSA